MTRHYVNYLLMCEILVDFVLYPGFCERLKI